MEIIIPELSACDFLEAQKSGIKVLDVRSPSEYELGHIPGSINMPLFSNDERAKVGTLYKREGQRPAIIEGLSIVGPKMKEMLLFAQKHAIDGEILVHCWRGGMRSSSVAWLLKTGGLNPKILEGGYKAYRHHIRQEFKIKKKIFVIGGMTGSGKTHLLSYLKSSGEQTIDLEALACHRGSAFGHVGLKAQPTNEQFENDLAAVWNRLDCNHPIYLEDESSHIGKVNIVAELYDQMGRSPLILLHVDRAIRVKNLCGDYGVFPKEILVECTEKISKKIGGDETKRIRELIEINDYDSAANALLIYYDKTYEYSLKKRDRKEVLEITLKQSPNPEIAQEITLKVEQFLKGTV